MTFEKLTYVPVVKKLYYIYFGQSKISNCWLNSQSHEQIMYYMYDVYANGLFLLAAEFHMLISFNTKFDFFIVLTAGKLPFLKKSLTIL